MIKKVLFAGMALSVGLMAKDGFPELQEYNEEPQRTQSKQYVLSQNNSVTVSVVGQGVSPAFARTPAQQYALAKRAAMTDAYRQIAEKIKGVYLEGEDTIQNMAVQRSSVRTKVSAMIKNAQIVETKFQDGLCEVEMEVELHYSDFQH